MMKQKEVHGLSKIPDDVLLRYANIEIGKLKAYIAELEDKLKQPENLSFENMQLHQLRKNYNSLLEENRRLKRFHAKYKNSIEPVDNSQNNNP